MKATLQKKLYKVVAASACFRISNLCKATNHCRRCLGHAHRRPTEVMSVGSFFFSSFVYFTHYLFLKLVQCVR